MMKSNRTWTLECVLTLPRRRETREWFDDFGICEQWPADHFRRKHRLWPQARAARGQAFG